MDELPLALTYDDVLLRPRHSSVRSRREVDTSSRFTRRIAVQAPVVSANMDTVTESRMAIAIAELGGVGVIHRFMSVAREVEEVYRVKRYQGRVIEEPYTIGATETIGHARAILAQLGVSGLLVVDGELRLLGILTQRDLRFASDSEYVADRMTPRERLVTAPADGPLEHARSLIERHRIEKLPLVDMADRVAGLITARDLERDHHLNEATRDEKGRLCVAAAVGVTSDYLERAEALAEAGADAIVIDIAHGDSVLMLEALAALKERLPDVELVAGNVATAEGAEALCRAGVDAIKVGVGPGATCITRQVAGVGMPQLTAILDAARAARPWGVPVVADGGVRYSGDIAKALAAGACTVMLGSLLAGTDESPGFLVERGGQKVKVTRGMASFEASVDRAFREDPSRGWATWGERPADIAPEGVQAAVPYRGPAEDVIRQLLAGLRSGMSYCDARTVPDLHEHAQLVRITQAGINESGPHDVIL